MCRSSACLVIGRAVRGRTSPCAQQPRLVQRPFLNIVSQRELADLGMQRLHIHGQRLGRAASRPPEHLGCTFLKLHLPLRDLIGMNVELLRELCQCFDRPRWRQAPPSPPRPMCGSGAVVVAWSLMICRPRAFLPSDRNSTYRPVQISAASSRYVGALFPGNASVVCGAIFSRISHWRSFGLHWRSGRSPLAKPRSFASCVI